MAFNLLELPTELTLSVLELLDSKTDLKSTVLACKGLRSLAEPLLYQSILIRSTTQLRKLLRAIDAHAHRRKSIHLLEFRGIVGDAPTKEDWPILTSILSKASKLQQFIFESPRCNSYEWEDRPSWDVMHESIFGGRLKLSNPTAKPFLPSCLRKVVVHMNGARSPFWILDCKANDAIFTLPLLQELVLSCVVLIDLPCADVRLKSSSSLKRLTLDECNITVQGLARILSMPKALEYLHLGENCHNLMVHELPSGHCNNLFKYEASETLAALAQQKSSLQSLVYTTNEHRALDRGPPGRLHESVNFSAFVKLEEVVLHGRCHNLEKAILGSKPPTRLKHLEWHADEVDICRVFRPSLRIGETPPTPTASETLHRLPFLRTADHIPETLRSVSLVFDSQIGLRRTLRQTISATFEDRLSSHLVPFGRAFNHVTSDMEDGVRYPILAAGKACESKGITLKVYLRPASRFIPPILFGEVDPEPRLLYNNVDGKGHVEIADLISSERGDDSSDGEVSDGWETESYLEPEATGSEEVYDDDDNGDYDHDGDDYDNDDEE